MNDRVSSSRFPYVSIRILIAGAAGDVEFSGDSLLDTGFEGEVMIPAEMEAELGATSIVLRWRMVDGTVVEAPSYPGEAQIAGLSDRHPVTVICLGSRLMIGREFLENYLVILDHGREVIVEP